LCVGENGCGSETESSAARLIEDTDAAAAADDDDDDDDDDGGDGYDGGGDTAESEVKLKVVEVEPSDSRHKSDVAERHSVTLYVSRLSQLIATLVDSMPSSLDVDRSLQQFASSFCTGDYVSSDI